MGTRGAIGFRFRDTDKLTYNHWDSYPTGLGVSALNTVLKWNDEQMAGAANRIEMVDQGDTPTPEQIEAYSEFANVGVGEQTTKDWYCLLREAQGDLDPYIDGRISHMIDGSYFLADSLFCEWAYIINMDTRMVEVYRGFNKNPDAEGRYARLTREERPNEYQGIKLLIEIPFDTIRSYDYAGLQAFCLELENNVYAVENKEYEEAQSRGS